MSHQRFFIGTRLPGLNEIVAASKVMKGKWSRYAELKVMYESMIKADIKAAKVHPLQGPCHDLPALGGAECAARLREHSRGREVH
jgi:hypothetical protein